MQRRSVGQTEGLHDIESLASSSQGSIPNSSSKTSRRSIAAAVANRALHEETRSKFFPMLILLMELSYSFVKGSSETYSIYALAGYTSSVIQVDAVDYMIKYRYLGALVVLPIGIVCDSYVGTFYPLMILLCMICVLMVLHAVTSLPLMLLSAGSKLWMAQITFITFALDYVVQPLKVVTISRAIMEGNYFRQRRNFYALLTCSLNLGIALGGTVVYFSLGSRYALCTIMFANAGLTIMHTAFYFVARREFMKDKSMRTTELGVIEKALAAIICSAFKYFDKYVFRNLVFKGNSGVEGEFRCFTFSQKTLKNAKTIVGIVLVTLPLVAAFTMFVLVDTLYYVQVSMFYNYPDNPFPLVSMKSYVYLLLFPLMEYCIFTSLRKWSKTEVSRQLTLIGIGCMCVGLPLSWSYAVHKIVRDGNDFWFEFPPDTGNVAITNGLNAQLYVRSQYMNYILDDDDGWVILPPFKTFTILNVPANSNPFHFEFTSTKLALYDEYFLPVEIGKPNWYLILPTGIFPFPRRCYRRRQKHVTLSTSYYGPAKICVVCALTICNGYVHFFGGTAEQPLVEQVPLVALTGRGTNQTTDASSIMTRLVGNFKVSAIFGGVFYTGSSRNATFERRNTYMIMVYEGSNDTTWKKDSWVIADTIEPYEESDIIRTFSLQTGPRFNYYMEWMYPTVVFHAIAEVFYKVSLWMFLFTQSTDEIRTAIFCFVETLRIPAYVYMHLKGALSLRHLRPMHYFGLAAINCFFIVVYFFCILFFIHKLFKVKPARKGSAEIAAQRRKSVMPAHLVKEKGK